MATKARNKFTPGRGGIKCPCCTFGLPSEVKPRLSRTARRLAKLELKKMEKAESSNG